jgi:HAD superfamily hydrolase (TIGR01509 family)
MFDSFEANAAYYNHILARFGLPSMSEDERVFVHIHTAFECVEYIFKNRGEKGRKRLQEALALLRTIDYSAFLHYMVIEPNLRTTLAILRSSHLTAVATNRTTTMPLILKQFQLKDLFDMVVTALDVKHPKPHPESLLKILYEFDLNPDEAIYVGDSPVDQIAAESAGMPFLSYRNPSLKATLHINSLDELEILTAES